MRIFLGLFGLICLISCQDIEEVKRPDDLIPEQKMVEVLTDLTVLNSAKNYNKRMLEEKGVRPKVLLFEKHGIDSLQLARSTQYYAKNYNRLESIYKRVKQNLQKKKAEYESIVEEERRIEDSIRALEEEVSDSVIQAPNRRRVERTDSVITTTNSFTY